MSTFAIYPSVVDAEADLARLNSEDGLPRKDVSSGGGRRAINQDTPEKRGWALRTALLLRHRDGTAALAGGASLASRVAVPVVGRDPKWLAAFDAHLRALAKERGL